jgi:hypothetical protein
VNLTHIPATQPARKTSRNAGYGRRNYAQELRELPAKTVLECDARSAYPPEILSKYRLPKATGNTEWCGPNGPRCVTCNRAGSPNFFNENGVCQYCEKGVN